MRKIVISILILSLAGCVGLPRKGEVATAKQIKRCERLGNVAMGMYGVGSLVGLGGFIVGAAYNSTNQDNSKIGFEVFGGSWATGIIGLGILGYMQFHTSCPMP